MPRLLALVVLVALIGPACVDRDPGLVPGERPTDVLVLGDSLTVGAAAAGGLSDRLEAAGFDPIVVADEGRDTGWGFDQVVPVDDVPPIVIVELGSNPGPTSLGFADEVEGLVSLLLARGAVRIAWLTPVVASDERYSQHIDILVAAAEAEPALFVADWRAEVRAHPERFAADGLHYTEAGYRALAQFMVATASRAADLAATTVPP